ncbi:protein kinase [Nocardioides sp. NPDC126508]
MIGPYRLEQQVASNDNAIVYKATDTRLNRAVAIKVLLGRSARDPEFVSRFDKQAALMAKLESPHIMDVYTNGRTAEGAPYLVSQYADGGDLGSLLKARGRLPGAIAADICAQIADGLAAIHSPEVGVVHGDVKPSNVLLRDGNNPPYAYLSDFAAARTDDAATARPGAHSGAWDYLAPERAMGAQPTAASDLYSLGCLFYALVTGNVPFTGGNDVETAIAHSSNPIPTLPGRDDFTLQANALLSGPGGLLAKDPAERTSDAVRARDRFAAMAGRQMGFSSGATVTLKRARSRWWIAAAAALVVVVAGGAATGITLKVTEDKPAKPRALVTGDFDGDGKGDLVFGTGFEALNGSRSLEPLLRFSSSGKTFRSAKELKGQYGKLMGDIDGDGIEDAVTVSGRGSNIAIDSNNKEHKNGSVQVPVSGRRFAILCDDFNGDKRADIVIVSVGNGKKLPADDEKVAKLKDLKYHFTVSLSQKDGTWSKGKDWLTGDWTGSFGGVYFAAGDVNGDGRADISFGSGPSEPGLIVGQMLISNGKSFDKVKIPDEVLKTFAEHTGAHSAIFADVDGDGRDELIEYQGDDQGEDIAVYDYESSSKTFVQATSWTLPDPVDHSSLNTDTWAGTRPMISDVNGDGKDDLVWGLLHESSETASLPGSNGSFHPITHQGTALVLMGGKSEFSVQKWKMPGTSGIKTTALKPLRNGINSQATSGAYE